MKNSCLKCNNALATSEAIYGLHGHCFIEWFHESGHTEFKDVDPKKTSARSGRSQQKPEIKKQNNTFFHGQYLKYSARLGSTEYILKVQEERYPELPLVEYLCNQIATILKIETPPFYLINFNGPLAFVTRNFMQDYTGNLVHIYNYLPQAEKNYNCEEIIKAIISQTERLADVVKFIEICLFDSLIGNNDRHGRNLGIIVTPTMKKIAPMYDNPSCLGIEPDFFLVSDANPSGSIWTNESKDPKPKDYIKEFQRLGYELHANNFTKKVFAQSSNILDTINASTLSQKRKDAFMKLIEKRIGEFKNEQH